MLSWLFQFSPEFAYRVFRPEHGFEVERVAMVEGRYQSFELNRRCQVLEVRDPDEMGQRVLRLSYRPAMLLVQARKTQHLADPFAIAPQQSDYIRVWEKEDALTPHVATGKMSRPWVRGRLQRLPPSVLRQLRIAREITRASRFNRRAYTPSR